MSEPSVPFENAKPGRPRLGDSQRAMIRENIQSIIANKYGGSRPKFRERLGVDQSTSDKWFYNPEVATSPDISVLAKIAENEEVSLDWLVFGRGRRDIQPDTTRSETVDALWECIRTLVELPPGLSREDVHRLLPSPKEVAEQVVSAYSSHVRDDYAKFSEFIEPGTSFSQLFVRKRIAKDPPDDPVHIVVESRWDESREE